MIYFIKYTDKVVRSINFISMITWFGIMLLTVIGIIFRLFGIPLSGLTNLSEYLLIIAVYCGVAYTQQVKQHVAVEFLISRVPSNQKNILNIINLIIPLVICTTLILVSWEFALESWRLREKMDGPPFYPIYPPKIAVAIGISILDLQLLVDLLKEIIQLFKAKNRFKES
jgi:TRAP-type C4-dicarboxylate transport system permease small subunit